jgi:hypothetical protein
MSRVTGSWRDLESELNCRPLEIFANCLLFFCGQKGVFFFCFSSLLIFSHDLDTWYLDSGRV